MASVVLNGLSARFQLQNGSIQFTSGETKAKDNLYFFMMFYATTRIYLLDFTPNTAWMIQSAVSYILSLQGLFVGKLKNAIAKYVPQIQVQSVATVYMRNTSPTAYGVTITYNYQDPTTPVSQQSVTFV